MNRKALATFSKKDLTRLCDKLCATLRLKKGKLFILTSLLQRLAGYFINASKKIVITDFPLKASKGRRRLMFFFWRGFRRDIKNPFSVVYSAFDRGDDVVVGQLKVLAPAIEVSLLSAWKTNRV
jgi:hypothetical protein